VPHLRYALRIVLKRPGPTLLVVLTLGVAIGAATVIYSVIDLVVHLIPAQNQTRLAYVASNESRVVKSDAGERTLIVRSPSSVPDLADWQARASSFDELAGFTFGSASLTGAGVPLRVNTIRVTANLPAMWGLTPPIGRSFRADEGLAASSTVVLLSHTFWQQQFSGDPGVLGRNVFLDAVPHTIVGVLPPDAGTGFFRDAEVFTPLVLDALRGARDQRDVVVTGRLKTGVTYQQATADLEAIARQLRAEHPESNQRISAVVLPLVEASGLNVRVLLSILGLIALLILVVACANVASVVVAQSMSRRHELAVHAALGASRADRIRQLVTESLLVSLPAGLIGLLLAAWAVQALKWLGGDTFGFADLDMNGRVLSAGMLMAFVAPLGFGLLPALRLGAPDPGELKDGSRSIGATLRGRRARNLVVGLQAAAAMVLMVQIALFVKTVWKLDDIAPGFEPAQVLTFRVGLPASRYDDQAITRFTTDLVRRLRAIPGIAFAGVIDRLPVADREPEARLTIEGTTPVPLEARPSVARAAIAGDFFTAMQVPVKGGRSFSNAEMSDGTPVALINEEAATRFWPGRNPIGSRVALDAAVGQEIWLEVVGIVGNLRNSDVDQGPQPQIFVSASWRPSGDMAVVVKSIGADPLQLVPAIRAQVASIDPNQPIFDIATMPQVLFNDLSSSYMLSAILTTVGFVALCLSALGIYGLVSYSVTQRRREIGVRMALGARPDSIVRMVVGQGARPVVIGSVVGLGAAMAVSLVLASAVPEMDPRDPLNYIGVTATILIVAFAASYAPARRAAAVNPIEALKQE
jgi:putative ABC transport system permease protein